jgi:hypothetical protein
MRCKELLVRAYKDVGAAHKLDNGDALVEEDNISSAN